MVVTDVGILLQTRYKNSDPQCLFKSHIPPHPSGTLWDELLRSKEIAVNVAQLRIVAAIQITKGLGQPFAKLVFDISLSS